MKLRFTRYIMLLAVIVIVSFVAGIAISRINAMNITERFILEAGEQLPPASLFFDKNAANAVYITDTSAINTSVPGIYNIEIKTDKKVFNSILEIKDTTAPAATVREIDLYNGESVDAEQFVENIYDATDVTVKFKVEPDFSKINTQEVSLVLSDISGNTSEYKTALRISKAKKSIQIEANNGVLNAADFLKNENDKGRASLVSMPEALNKVGNFPVQIAIDGKVYESEVVIVDTVPPVGTAERKNGWLGKKLDAMSFITEIDDITEVTAKFLKEPNFDLAGEQQVTIVLTDEGANETVVNSMLTLEEDNIPPKIYGTKKVTLYIGQPVSYKKGVLAEDNCDGIIDITVDSSQVNPKVEGEYIVYYTAEDSSGNSVTEEVKVTVKEQSVTVAELEELADKILAEITTEDMTLREKAWEIYQYVNKHLTYTNFSDKTDWMKEAYNGITRGVGDCFTYYSMSHLFLNRIGMQTLSVERDARGDENKHYWHLVNYGEGWYHFDACIHIPKLVSFMLTDAEMDAFSRRAGKNDYYYRFKKENYPRTPEK